MNYKVGDIVDINGVNNIKNEGYKRFWKERSEAGFEGPINWRAFKNVFEKSIKFKIVEINQIGDE